MTRRLHLYIRRFGNPGILQNHFNLEHDDYKRTIIKTTSNYNQTIVSEAPSKNDSKAKQKPQQQIWMGPGTWGGGDSGVVVMADDSAVMADDSAVIPEVRVLLGPC